MSSDHFYVGQDCPTLSLYLRLDPMRYVATKDKPKSQSRDVLATVPSREQERREDLCHALSKEIERVQAALERLKEITSTANRTQ